VVEHDEGAEPSTTVHELISLNEPMSHHFSPDIINASSTLTAVYKGSLVS